MADPAQVPFKGSDGSTRQRAMRNSPAGGLSSFMAIDDDHLAAMMGAAPSGVAPLTGSASVVTDIGPFTPVLGRLVFITAQGNGSAQLLRSVDGGTTRLPVTAAADIIGPWTGSGVLINEPVWLESESGATLYLRLSPTTGTMTGRLAQ